MTLIKYVGVEDQVSPQTSIDPLRPTIQQLQDENEAGAVEAVAALLEAGLIGWGLGLF